MVEIAIVDDEVTVLKSLEIGLGKSGYQVKTFSRATPFLAFLKGNEPDMVFLDLLLPDGHGMDLLREIRRSCPHVPVIIITAHGDIPSAVQAMRLGAFDYISKPFDLEVIEMGVERAVKEGKLLREVMHHRNRAHQQTTLSDIIGDSAPMQRLFSRIRRLGKVDATTVLILGESGTGKDLLAKAIHNQSARKELPFIEINCAALPEPLLESELFGHERGAFTDARTRKIGLAELADGGTLFLDEVGELPIALQAKLLKFLETRTFRRVGGTDEIKVDLFIIAATNQDLEKSVAEKVFREDLYYRMAVVPLTMPPLRERTGDVDLLVTHYWKVFTHKFHKPGLILSPEVRRVLLDYDWPGNIRELRNLLERLVILSDRHGAYLDDLPNRFLKKLAPAMDPSQSPVSFSRPLDGREKGGTLVDAVDALEMETITRAMAESGGVKSRAAKKLGISRFALMRRLKRLGLS